MLTKPPTCEWCPLFKDGQGFAGGEGPKDAKVVLVGEALGETEAISGRPFVGGTGRMLRMMIQQGGLNEREVYITNAVKCRPPNNRPPTTDEINFCTKAYLWDELVAIKPNVVVPVGDIALHTILPNSPKGITNVRGSLFGSPWGKVLPIVHPSFVARGNPEFWGITVHDLLRVRSEQNDTNIRIPEERFHIRPSLDNIKRTVDLILEGNLAFAFDLETIGQREKLNILCFGFAWTPNDAMCIPLLRRGGYTYWESETDEETAWGLILQLLSSTCRKITQNGFTFDLPVLMDVGARVEPPVVDTLVNHHVVATELPHSLEFLTSVYTNYPYYKSSVKSAGGMLWAPDETIWLYNCRDCVATYVADLGITEEMKEMGLL